MQTIPKVELHCHLDGSITLGAYKKLLGMHHKELPDEETIKRQLHAPDKCENLAAYLSIFDHILKFLQTEQSLVLAAYSLIQSAAEDNVAYIEVRFAPELHCQNGLTNEQAVSAVLKGLENGERDFGVKSRAILCMMRHNGVKQNTRTLESALNLRQYGVAAIDIAGDENIPIGENAALFKKAAEKGMAFTIHAGECGSFKNVIEAVELGASRIGHGIAVIKDKEALQLCIDRNVMLEVCPTSNVQTNIVETFSAHPFEKLYQSGVLVSVSTDNRTVSNVTLEQEWRTVQKHFPAVDDKTVMDINIKSAEAAFLTKDEKESLIKKIKSQ